MLRRSQRALCDTLAYVRRARPEELTSAKQGERLPSEYNAWDPDGQQWVLRYTCIEGRLGKHLRDVYHELDVDADTEAWLRSCLLKPIPTWQQRYVLLLYKLQKFLYFYDAQVIAGVPRLFMMSTAQWQTAVPKAYHNTTVLDVGAGKGDLLDFYSPVFKDIYCTEVSRLLCWILERRAQVKSAFRTTNVDINFGLPADVDIRTIMCLNTLDRCNDPTKLMKAIRPHVAQGALAVVSLPLPYYHLDFLQRGSLGGLNLDGDGTFEGSAEAVAADLLIPNGLKPVKFMRVPYMSSGPYDHPLSQILDTGVFICKVMF